MSILEITVQFNESVNSTQTLTLDGVIFQLTTYTNKADNSWYLDVADDVGEEIVTGIRMVAASDLLFPYRYKDVPAGALFVQSQTGLDVDPTLDSFQNGDAALYYETVNGD